MKKEMLINVLQPEECRIAILEDGVLEELYVERTSHESYVGNIYKGRVVNIEPSIQAAFVDFGVGRNGFLHVSDVEPAYYRHLEQRGGRDRDHDRDRDRDWDQGGGRRGGRDRDRDRGRRQPEGRQSSRRREPIPLPDIEYLPDVENEPREPQSPMDLTPTEEIALVPPPQPVEPDAESAEALAPAPEEHAPPADLSFRAPEPESTPSGEPLQAIETPAEPEPPRGRRRTRGGSRRRKAEPAAETPEPTSEGPEAAPPAEHPRLMDSAERRTEEGETGPEVEGAAPAPTTPSSEIRDDDLFFPREPAPEPTRSAPAPAPREIQHTEPEPAAHAPERSFEPAPALDEALAEAELPPPEEEWADEPSPEPEPEPTFGEAAESDFGEEDSMDDFDDPLAGLEEDATMPRRSRRDNDRRGDDRRGGGGRRGGPRRGGPGGGGRNGFGRPKPLIQDIFRRGQEVLVQVIKEGIGTKGPTLSTYISIPGRYLVLMPSLNRVGVSRKIADEEARRRLREIFNELKPPKGLGFIVRTAAIDRNKKELQSDLAYLSRLWQVVVRRIHKIKSPAEIYQESDMITRTIRDTFTSDIDCIWVDEPAAYERAKEFMQIVMPRYANRIKLYEGKEPLFHKYGIEEEIARIQRRHVPLPHGGSIVIDQTEAMVAIDVNSGNFRADNNAEETAYQMNLQAAKEIARQLRLRDLGGVIVNDFIDMRDEKHRRAVEKTLRDAVKRDRARTKILKTSAFGLIEMTRQRIRPSLKRSVYQDCPHCMSTGQVKTTESMSIDVMRLLQLAAHRENIQRVQVRVAEDVANYLHNKKRQEIAQLEQSGSAQVQINGVHSGAPELLEFVCYDNHNNEVKFGPYDDTRSGRR